MATEIFWLHIKKSAGLSTRQILKPYYVETDRTDQPKNFIQSDPAEWNDILNNYRVPLGAYQFKRTLFAKTYLYKDKFENLFKFAFSRNPYDRAISQFFYLWRETNPRKRTFWSHRLKLTEKAIRDFPALPTLSYDFSLFLDAIQACRGSQSNFDPYDLHFQTHTAAMFEDVSDENGTILLDKIWRLEDFETGIAEVFERMGALYTHKTAPRINTTKRQDFSLNKNHKQKIEALFTRDFDIYETCKAH